MTPRDQLKAGDSPIQYLGGPKKLKERIKEAGAGRIFTRFKIKDENFGQNVREFFLKKFDLETALDNKNVNDWLLIKLPVSKGAEKETELEANKFFNLLDRQLLEDPGWDAFWKEFSDDPNEIQKYQAEILSAYRFAIIGKAFEKAAELNNKIYGKTSSPQYMENLKLLKEQSNRLQILNVSRKKKQEEPGGIGHYIEILNKEKEFERQEKEREKELALQEFQNNLKASLELKLFDPDMLDKSLEARIAILSEEIRNLKKLKNYKLLFPDSEDFIKEYINKFLYRLSDEFEPIKIIEEMKKPEYGGINEFQDVIDEVNFHFDSIADKEEFAKHIYDNVPLQDAFRNFLMKTFTSENLDFILAVQSYLDTGWPKAQYIYNEFISETTSRQVNLPAYLFKKLKWLDNPEAEPNDQDKKALEESQESIMDFIFSNNRELKKFRTEQHKIGIANIRNRGIHQNISNKLRITPKSKNAFIQRVSSQDIQVLTDKESDRNDAATAFLDAKRNLRCLDENGQDIVFNVDGVNITLGVQGAHKITPNQYVRSIYQFCTGQDLIANNPFDQKVLSALEELIISRKVLDTKTLYEQYPILENIDPKVMNVLTQYHQGIGSAGLAILANAYTIKTKTRTGKEATTSKEATTRPMPTLMNQEDSMIIQRNKDGLIDFKYRAKAKGIPLENGEVLYAHGGRMLTGRGNVEEDLIVVEFSARQKKINGKITNEYQYEYALVPSNTTEIEITFAQKDFSLLNSKEVTNMLNSISDINDKLFNSNKEFHKSFHEAVQNQIRGPRTISILNTEFSRFIKMLKSQYKEKSLLNPLNWGALLKDWWTGARDQKIEIRKLLKNPALLDFNTPLEDRIKILSQVNERVSALEDRRPDSKEGLERTPPVSNEFEQEFKSRSEIVHGAFKAGSISGPKEEEETLGTTPTRLPSYQNQQKSAQISPETQKLGEKLGLEPKQEQQPDEEAEKKISEEPIEGEGLRPKSPKQRR